MNIIIKTPEEINIMRHNGRVLSHILKTLKNDIRPGTTAGSLETLANQLIKKEGGIPSFRGFDGYPAALCVSINEEIVHALPLKEKIIREGDIVSLDLGFFKNEFHSDSAFSVGVGKIDKRAKKLLHITRESLDDAIRLVKPGIKLGQISHSIQKKIESANFFVIRDLTGHGVGKDLHEDPQILNYGDPDTGPVLREGMVIAIEPMAAIGSSNIKQGNDGFAYVTKDGSLSAHFEHTVLVTSSGSEVLTK